jgi:hypothetical protein
MDEVVGVLIDAVDAAADVADIVPRRKRRTGCLILSLLVIAGVLIWYFVLS